MNINSIVNYFQNLYNYIVKPKVKPQPGETKVTLVDVINAYNTPYVRHYKDQVDAQIFVNPPERNLVIANLILSESLRLGIDYIYLAACIAQESRFSELCFNHNLAEHNGIESFEGTDWGMTQQSGIYLPERPGMPPKPNVTAMTTNEAASAITDWQNKMKALAFTAEFSVPLMATIMTENLMVSEKELKNDEVLAAAVKKLNTTALTDAQALATSMYNRGTTGAITYFKENNAAMLKHFIAVGTGYSNFKKVLT
jgi:hypothetical protein